MNIYLDISSHTHSTPAQRCCEASRELERRSCCRTFPGKNHREISSCSPPPPLRHCPVLRCWSLSLGEDGDVSWNWEQYIFEVFRAIHEDYSYYSKNLLSSIYVLEPLPINRHCYLFVNFSSFFIIFYVKGNELCFT